MPQFIADTDGEVTGKAWDDLSPFVQGYIECILFTETSHYSMTEWHDEETQEALREGSADGNIPDDSGFADMHPDTLVGIIADCEAFQLANEAYLAEAYGHHFPARIIGDGSLPDSRRSAWDYDAEAAGRDFWYTRNGHGVGFWDRDLGDVGDKLSEACKGFGEVNAWFSEEVDDTSPTGYGFWYLE